MSLLNEAERDGEDVPLGRAVVVALVVLIAVTVGFIAVGVILYRLLR